MFSIFSLFFVTSFLTLSLLSKTKQNETGNSTATPNKYSAKELRLMRTQDIRYLASRATHEARAAERLARALHGIGVPRPPPSKESPSHVVFVDSAPQVRRFDPVGHFGTPAELLERHYNRPRLLAAGGGGGGGGGSVGVGGSCGGSSSAAAAAAAGSLSSSSSAARQQQQQTAPLVAFPRGTRPDRAAMKADKQRLASYAELARRRKRAAKLAGLEGALRKTQALSGKGRVRRLSPAEALRATGGDNDGRGVKGKVYKWAKVRKR